MFIEEPRPATTLQTARKIAGKSSMRLSDTDTEKLIEVSEMFKNLFFQMLPDLRKEADM